MKSTSYHVRGKYSIARYTGLLAITATALLATGSVRAGSIDPGTSGGPSGDPSRVNTQAVSASHGNESDRPAPPKDSSKDGAADPSHQLPAVDKDGPGDRDASDLLVQSTYHSAGKGNDARFHVGEMLNASLPAGQALNTWGDVGRRIAADLGHVIPIVHASGSKEHAATDMGGLSGSADGTGNVFDNSGFLGPRNGFDLVENRSNQHSEHHADTSANGGSTPGTPAPVPLPATFWAAGLLLGGFVTVRALRARSVTPQIA